MDIVIIVLVFTVAVTASILDVKSYRIPNWLTLWAVVIGFFINVYYASLAGFLLAGAGMVVGGLILLPFFLLGGMGGGDVKLAAGFGALGGPYFVVNTLLLGSLFGGIAGVIFLIRKYGYKNSLLRIFAAIKMRLPQEEESNVLPYGVFLALGAVLSCFMEVI